MQPKYKYHSIEFYYLPIVLFWFITFSFQTVGNEHGIHGVKSMGMGSTFSGFNSTPEVAWINPAALSTINEKIIVNGGAYISWYSTKFQLSEPTSYQAVTDNPIKFPYFFNLSVLASDRLTFGLNVNSAYSYHINWQEENWAGRFIVQGMDISSIALQPSVSYQINDFISAGAGMILTSSEITFTRGIPVRDQNREGSMKITGKSNQPGFIVAFFSNISENLNLGLSYRSALNMNFDDASIIFLNPNSLQNYFPVNNTVNVNYPGSAVIDFTGGWRKSALLEFAWGIAYTIGSTNENTTFDFNENTIYLPDYNIIRNNRDDLKIRLGAEYQPAEFLLLRAGTWYQTRAGGIDFVAPDKPQTSKIAFTTGTSFIPIPGFAVDLSISFITSPGKSVNYAPANFEGIYKTYSFISGLGVSYIF